MRRFPFYGFLVAGPALAFLIVMAGCSGTTSSTGGGGGTESTGPSGTGEKKAVEAKGYATIKGKVTFDGDPPKTDNLADSRQDFKEHKDKEHCLKGDTNDPSWEVGENKGIANVAVWVKPAGNAYFTAPPDDKKAYPKEVAVDQPFCRYSPYMTVLYAKQFDGKKMVDTDQKFMVKNSAPITHNTKYAGDSVNNPGGNETLAPKGEKAIKLNADSRTPIQLSCDIHKWMTGWVWALDTPHAAVTKGEAKADASHTGEFEIKNVPAGADLTLYGWHGAKKWVLPEGDGKATGMKVEALKDGEVREVNFKIKK